MTAVERVREGEPAAEVIAACRFNRTTIYKWLRTALQPGVGIKALRPTRATGALLAKLGLTPQKPLQRAYQGDPQAIQRRQRETYPALAK